jgi:putative protease
MKRVELLAPAGNFEKLKYALAYGADAVYAGVPMFSLRVRDNDFSLKKLKESIEYTHNKDKKIYLTLNIYPHNRKIKSFISILKQMAGINPDGIILSDPGVILMAREYCPGIPIHLSTQANTVNWMSVKFWQNLGISRIILSRELSLKEIKEIRDMVDDIDLESFVHGAICIAYSGRCLLSNYFNHRDPNQGTCTNSCRWRYKVYKNNSPSYYLEEGERPGILMPVAEDEFGTYILNSKDLCTIKILDKLITSGIDSFKIEGRTKSIYYLSIITRAYRLALDTIFNKKLIDTSLEHEMYAVANRGYMTGFLEKKPAGNGQNYASSQSENQTHLYCGKIYEFDSTRRIASISVRNPIKIGDTVELVSPPPAPVRNFKITAMYSMDTKKIESAHGGGKEIKILIPFNVPPFSLLRKSILPE